MTTPSQTETARPLDGAMENILDDGQRPGWWRHFAGHEDTECVIRPMHLASLLDRAARTHGNRLAIRFQNFQMTYSRLHEAAERFAEALRLRGVKPGQRVAVMLPNIPQTVIAFWGIMKAGAVAVMTNPLYMEKELLHHFNDAGAEVLVTLDLLWAKLEPLRDRLPLRLTVVTNISDGLAFPLNWLYRIKARRQGQVPQVPYGQEVLRWKDFIKVRGRFSVPTDEDPGDALALLQYTGGTSGQPKGAMLGHACISAQMQQLLAILHMDWENCKPMSFLSIMPFFHVFGLVGNIILPTALAATTIPVPRYTPADLLRTIARFRPTFFVGAHAAEGHQEIRPHLYRDLRLRFGAVPHRGPAPLGEHDPRQHHRRFRPDRGLALRHGQPAGRPAEGRLHRRGLPAYRDPHRGHQRQQPCPGPQ